MSANTGELGFRNGLARGSGCDFIFSLLVEGQGVRCPGGDFLDGFLS